MTENRSYVPMYPPRHESKMTASVSNSAKVVIVYIDAGGGHRASANALSEVFRRQNRPWSVELVNADDVLDPSDPPLRLVGLRTNDFYNLMLRHGWTYGTRELLPIVHGVCRMLHPRQVRLLREAWKRLKPDLVISVIPHLNRALFESLHAECPQTKFVTLLTDIADYPPRFWLEPQPQYYICGSETAYQQAKSIATNAIKIWKTSGMVIHPRFYDETLGPEQVVRDSRQELGLHPDLPTGLVLFGGYGSKLMLKIARQLAASRTRTQLILICGRNQRLAQKLRSLELPFPCHVEEFTEKLPHFMRLADFFIGKPGSGSLSEALSRGLPVVLKSGAATMVHERYNIGWIKEKGIGLEFRKVRELPSVLDRLLEPACYQETRRRVLDLRNRAVFEVPDIIEEILAYRVKSAGA